MYHHLSRSLYRRLAPMLEKDASHPDLGDSRLRLLDACEETMKRLAADPDYFAYPTRSLFRDIQPLFPISAQLRVLKIVDRDLMRAAIVLEQERALTRRDCAALTRRSSPNRREPVGADRYCPSHRHLAYEFGPRIDEEAQLAPSP
jgi:hypothetical protein